MPLAGVCMRACVHMGMWMMCVVPRVHLTCCEC